MALPNRETLRDDLLTNLKTLTGLSDDAGAVAHVFGQLPATFNGLSPVATIENGGWKPDPSADDSGIFPVRLIVGFWDKIGTRANVEDSLDLFAHELTDLLSKTYNARYYEISQPFYEIMDGADYRGEFHFIEFDQTA